MTDFRPTLYVIGYLLVVLALAMVIPGVVDLVFGRPEWQAFAGSAAVTLFVGLFLTMAFRQREFSLTVRQGFILTTLSWVMISIFAAIPFVVSPLKLSAADAFFEAMSGLTTTGSTVVVGLDQAPPGILLWRALLQWLGGIGIVVMAVAILPILSIGGMQLFRTESSDRSEKFLPRAAQVASSITVLYVVLTIVWVAAYWSAGMSGFDAICHAMTTLATGGYSTHDGSLGHFDDIGIEIIAITGMLAGSMPFVLYLRMLRGRGSALWMDSQVQWFIGTCAAMIAVTTVWLLVKFGLSTGEALRLAAFNIVSVITGTGYATADYARWGTLAVALMFFIMFVGGCTGSTTGGIKVFRFQVMFQELLVQIQRLAQPRGIFVPRYNGKPIPDSVAAPVLAMFFMFFAAFGVVALLLALHGYDFVTSISGAATAVANVGPALGSMIGPSGTFAELEDSAKWILSAAMLLGRLELFTVLVLFLPAFWRN